MSNPLRAREILFLVLLSILVITCKEKETLMAGKPEITALTSNYVFSYENWMQPRVWNLRRQENLDEVVKGLSQDRQIFEALTLWARQQFEPGFPDPYPLSNGISILEDIRSGKTKGFCGQYAYLLADALKSFGFFDVRYVEVSLDERTSHFLLEGWDNQTGGWMLLDPLYATVVINQAALPLGAWDVHDAVRKGLAQQLKRVWLATEQQVPRGPDEKYFALFRNTAVSLRNNLAEMDHPWTIRERERDFLLIEESPSSPQPPYQNRSNRLADFKQARNLTWIEVGKQGDGYQVTLSNRGTCAHFDHFEIKIDQNPWTKVPEEFLLKRDFKTLYCRTVNKMGIPGIATKLEKT